MQAQQHPVLCLPCSKAKNMGLAFQGLGKEVVAQLCCCVALVPGHTSDPAVQLTGLLC